MSSGFIEPIRRLDYVGYCRHGIVVYVSAYGYPPTGVDMYALMTKGVTIRKEQFKGKIENCELCRAHKEPEHRDVRIVCPQCNGTKTCTKATGFCWGKGYIMATLWRQQ